MHINAHTCTPKTALIDSWLTRSGQCPLSFSILESCLENDRDEGVPNSALILYMFIPYFHRWQNVRLECIDWRTNSGLSHLPDSPAPLLESIYLQRSFWIETDKEPLSRMMESSPRLHDVSWISIQPGLPSIPWSQLTDIFLGCSISVDACLDLLLQSPQLVHCQVTMEVVLQHPTPTTSVVLPHLESLDFSTNGDIGPLLPCLTLPYLKSFTLIHQQLLHNVPERAHWPHTQFMSLLSRSGCTLMTLNLHDTVIQPSDLIDCLRKVSSSLVNLNLSNDWLKHSSVTEELLKMMIYRTPDEDGIPTYLCPYIREFKFWESISSSRSTLIALADMVQSRWDPDFDMITGGRPPHVALRRTIKFCLIVLRSEPPPDEQVFARLSALSGSRLGAWSFFAAITWEALIICRSFRFIHHSSLEGSYISCNLLYIQSFIDYITCNILRDQSSPILISTTNLLSDFTRTELSLILSYIDQHHPLAIDEFPCEGQRLIHPCLDLKLRFLCFFLE